MTLFSEALQVHERRRGYVQGSPPEEVTSPSFSLNSKGGFKRQSHPLPADASFNLGVGDVNGDGKARHC